MSDARDRMGRDVASAANSTVEARNKTDLRTRPSALEMTRIAGGMPKNEGQAAFATVMARRS